MGTLNQVAAWAQIVATPIAVIAIVVSIWLYVKSKQKKAITCIFDQVEFPIEIKAGSAFDGDIEILYQGKPVKNIFLMRVNIKNTGNSALRAADIVIPLTFDFDEDTILLREPRTIQQRPSNLTANWDIAVEDNSRQRLRFLFDLLNPGDELSAEFTCTGKPKTPRVTARIAGLSQVETVDSEERQLRKKLTDGLYLPFAVVISILANYFSKALPTHFSTPIAIVLAFLWIVGLLGLLGLFLVAVWVKFFRPLIGLIQYRRSKTGKS